MAMYLDVFIDRGTTWNTSFTIHDVNGIPVDFSNCTLKGQVKKSYITSNVSANITTTLYNSNTEVGLSLPYQTTANLSPYRYVFDVVSLDTANNTVNRIVEGTIFISPSVSTLP